MASVFITYADERFKVSADRIVRQARKSKRFDKVIKYTPKDLPEYVKASPLFAETRGGGCWCWKPYVIWDALRNCEVGDVVYYADAGCSIVADSPEWDEFYSYLQSYSAIYFQYRKDYPYPGWDRYCGSDCKDRTVIKHWMKPSVIEYFKQYKVSDLFEFSSIWAGFIIIKKTESFSIILDEWRRITLYHPELVALPFGSDLVDLPHSYCEHRHDQSILSPLVSLYKEGDNALVLPETSESMIGYPAVLATRWRQAALPPLQYIRYRIYEFMHRK